MDCRDGFPRWCTHVNDLNDTYGHSEDGFGDSSNSFNLFVKEELISGLIFDSIDDAENFYMAYAKAEGFNVRRRSLQKKGALVKNRVWVCNRNGFRSEKEEHLLREDKPLTRCGCKATFRVVLDINSGKYNVCTFVNEHNHELHQCMNSYLSPSDKATLSLLTNTGFKPSQVIHYLEQLAGGAEKLSFKRKTAYNWLNKLRAERILKGDVNRVIKKFKDLKDDRLFYKYCVDEEGILTRLFWADGASRAEYEAFGDVLVFDSTYKTNTYLYPLVIFSGVNNHGSTCIFAASVIQDETIETYQWVLQTLLESMGGKIPEAVLTDQDAAMRSAIVSEFSGTRHRICSWHLCRNVRKNIKNSIFCNEFCSLIDRKCSVEEFELAWSNIVEKHDLSNNKWVVATYEIRERWAEAYFRTQFMSMMRTTQRAESVNSLIKLSVDHKMTLTDFISHYDRTLQRLRSDFKIMQKESEQTKRKVRESPLKSFDEHALNLYTLRIYFIIRKELRDEQGVLGESRSKDMNGNDVFVFSEEKDNEVLKYTVIVDQSNLKFECDCFKLESEGVPCRHVISTFQYLRIKKFPDNMIKRRWLKETGTKLLKKIPEPRPVSDIQQQRFGLLSKETLLMSAVSSQTEKGFSSSLKCVRELADMAQDELMMQSQCGSVPSENNVKEQTGTSVEGLEDRPIEKVTSIVDPCRNKTRGATGGRKQKCGICGVLGHKSTTCVLKNPANNDAEKKRSEKKKKTSSSPEETNTEVEDLGQHIPSQEIKQLPIQLNTFQHLGSYGPLSQFPLIFNMQQSSPILLNMPQNPALLSLYPQPMVPATIRMNSLGSENVMGPNTTLLWQQENGTTSGSAPYIPPS